MEIKLAFVSSECMVEGYMSTVSDVTLENSSIRETVTYRRKIHKVSGMNSSDSTRDMKRFHYGFRRCKEGRWSKR